MESAHESARIEVKTDTGLLREQLQRAGLKPGMDCADLGCGTAVAARQMVHITGASRITAVDISADRIAAAANLAAAETADIEMVVADVQTLPLETDAYDFSWARFLFEYLADPLEALRHIKRITRPGGIITLLDLDAQLTTFYPLTQEMDEALRFGLGLLESSGFDVYVGRKLADYCRQAGLENINIHVMPYQVYFGNLTERDQQNWDMKLAGAAAYLEKAAPGMYDWHVISRQLYQGMVNGDLFYYAPLIQVTATVPKR